MNWIKLLKADTDTIVWKIKQIFNLRYINISYSQEGEDQIIHVLKDKEKGFYVDVGANHPKRCSNTYRLYLEGWRGIAIDFDSKLIKLFKKYRKEDNSICAAISSEEIETPAYFCKEPAFNSLNKDFCSENIGRIPQNTVMVKTKTLKQIFDEYKVKEIDFLNIDVEGSDLQVLLGNDWEKYVPKLIAIEILTPLKEISSNPIHCFLNQKGYDLVAKTPLTSFYKKS